MSSARPIRSAGCQPAVSPIANRQTVRSSGGRDSAATRQVGNLRYGRLAVCATRESKLPMHRSADGLVRSGLEWRRLTVNPDEPSRFRDAADEAVRAPCSRNQNLSSASAGGCIHDARPGRNHHQWRFRVRVGGLATVVDARGEGRTLTVDREIRPLRQKFGAHRTSRRKGLEPRTRARVPVQPGDVFELEAWVKVAGAGGGSATLCVSTYDAQGQATDWSYGARSVREPHGLAPSSHAICRAARASRRFSRASSVMARPRFGWTIIRWKRNRISTSCAAANLPVTLVISNAVLEVTLNTSNATLAVLDRRTGPAHRTKAAQARHDLAGCDGDSATRSSSRCFTPLPAWKSPARFISNPNVPEFTFELSAQGELPNGLSVPASISRRKPANTSSCR